MTGGPSYRLPNYQDQWPERDPTAADGLYWARPDRVPGRADIVRHEHECADGTVVECSSQWIATTGVTLDRWRVGGVLLATSARREPNTMPPNFAWADPPADWAA